nr:hypothetical protein [Rhodoferax sp.]
MNAVFKVKAYVCGVVMLCTAMGSAGLTLGRAQGAIFVGKPLDLRVQLQADASEELQSSCMSAEVFYGETLVDPSRVSVSIDDAQGAGGKGPTVRVTAAVLIDEPIVTVNFRVGCQQKSSKRYTLFPDVATNVVEPASRAPAPRGAAADVALPVAGATATGSARASDAKPKRSRSTPVAPEAASASKPAPMAKVTGPAQPVDATAGASPPFAKAAAKTSGKSRLKLDPLDLSIERDPVLRATTELLTMPQENAALRAEAAALWRALNASPEELLLDEAKARAFEKDLKSLYAVTAENQKGLVDLVAKVQRAESQRYANGLVYTLAALCLVLLLGLVWVWRRARAARPMSWMEVVDDADDSLMAELVKSPPVSRTSAHGALASRPAALSAAAPKPVITPTANVDPPAAVPLTTLDFDLDAFELHPKPKADVAASPPASTARPPSPGGARDLSMSVSGGLRAIDSAELLDVRQQADFFLALGEHQKAIDVLTTRIAQVGESSPLVCLDLLKIYHKLGRESEFEFMRQEFNNWFTGRVPVIDDFSNEGRSLEKYPKVIDQIVALWPDSRVLEYIENCIYHHSTDVYEPDFDLLAYRELLLLHGIAKRIVRLSDDAGDGHAIGLVRMAARAPSGAAPDVQGNGEVPQRVGAQHRGAWKRNPVNTGQTPDPETEVETRGAPLGAMRLPPAPVVVSNPDGVVLGPDGEVDPGNTTDFDFLSFR